MLKLDIPRHICEHTFSQKPVVGNLYVNIKGHYHLIYRISERDRTCFSMQFDSDGSFRQTSGYAVHYWEEKKPIGYVEQIPQFTIDIKWLYEAEK